MRGLSALTTVTELRLNGNALAGSCCFWGPKAPSQQSGPAALTDQYPSGDRQAAPVPNPGRSGKDAGPDLEHILSAVTRTQQHSENSKSHVDQLGNRSGGSTERGSFGGRDLQQDGVAVSWQEGEAQRRCSPRVPKGTEGAGLSGGGQSRQAGPAAGERGGEEGWALLQRLELGQNSIVNLPPLSLATFSGALATKAPMLDMKPSAPAGGSL